MTGFTVVYDACVLYPAPLRDFLLHLAMTDVFRAKWSNEIHHEWMRNVLKDRPDLTLDKLERTKTLMDENVRDCLVKNYHHLTPAMSLPDPDDNHVLAAAVHSTASVIVTYNLKDFPNKVLSKYNVEAQHPDEFIADLLDLNPESVYRSAKNHRASLRNPSLSVEQYLNNLLKQSLVVTVAHLKKFQSLL